ncbi:MAG: alkaline phosphatase family protein [Halobacteriales archaeon]
MLRADVEASLRWDYGEDGALFPAYDSYCFGNLPDTIRTVFDVEGQRPLPEDVRETVRTDVGTVVLVLIDGYGLDSWKRDRCRHEFIARMTDHGRVTPLTSVYPPETAAAITTLGTGQLPCEHGRIGWNVYEPETDRSFLALDGEIKAGGLGGKIAPEATEDVSDFYGDLCRAGVEVHRLHPFETKASDATNHTYDDLGGFGRRLHDVIESSGDPGYVYAYLPQIDHISHTEGTESDAFQEVLDDICKAVTEFVDGLDPEIARETLVLVTADHGHVNTDPAVNIDLSERAKVVANLRRHADGTPIRMARSPRNTHLHLQPGTAAETQRALSDLNARCFTREDAFARELFGDRDVSDRFRRRCGDLILTHRDLRTWWGDAEPDELAHMGMHGGLNPAEMLVPFGAVRADRL